jgi:hypothetical protein
MLPSPHLRIRHVLPKPHINSGVVYAHAKAVAEAGADFSDLDFMSLGEGKCVQPCRGRTARAAKQVCACAPPFCRAGMSAGRQRLCAPCREKSRCAAVIVSRLSGLTTSYSGGHRVQVLTCTAAHWVRSCTPQGPSNGRKASGPFCWLCGWWQRRQGMRQRLPLGWCRIGRGHCAKGEGHLCSDRSVYPGQA